MLFFTLILMGILNGIEVDIFVPSFPELQHQFGITPFMVEWTLSINLLAHGAAALVVGNLGDRYGRKPIILAGFIVFILGSIACVFATEFWHILLGRFLQGIGIAGSSVLSYLVIADLYNTEKQQSLMGVLNGVITLAMAFAPVLGSYITLYFHWQGNFVAMLIVGIACFLLGIRYLPKATPQPEVQLSIASYLPVLRSSLFYYYTFAVQCFCLAYWVFVGIAPILYMEDLGVSLEHYGFYQGSTSLTFAIFSFGTGWMLRRFGTTRCFHFGAIVLVLFIFGVIGLLCGRVQNPLAITLVCHLLAAGNILPINILWPMSLECVPGAKGRVAALMVVLRLAMMSLGIQIVSYFYTGRFFELGLAMNFFVIGGLIFSYILILRRGIFQSALKPIAST